MKVQMLGFMQTGTIEAITKSVKEFNEFVKDKNVEKVEKIEIGNLSYALVYWT